MKDPSFNTLAPTALGPFFRSLPGGRSFSSDINGAKSIGLPPAAAGPDGLARRVFCVPDVS